MPDIGSLHPLVIHFVVAGLFVGLPIYFLSFMPRPRFLRPMATVLLLIGTVAAFVAVQSGTDAHGPVERIPGVRDAVVRHEELGEETRTVFAVVLLLELASLGIASRLGGETEGAAGSSPSLVQRAPMVLKLLVAAGWVFGATVLFEAAEHGGELVYEYGGGVGFRSGDTPEVEGLLRAGLFHQSRIDREAGRHEDAARLIDELAARFPESVEVQLLRTESLILDRADGRGALDALAAIDIPEDNPRMLLRKVAQRFDAYLMLEMPDSAAVALDAVPERYAESRAVTERRAKLAR
jgi:uncharacterized membrane protein